MRRACEIFSALTPILFARSRLRRVFVRQKFMQRRIQEADGRRQAFQLA